MNDLKRKLLSLSRHRLFCLEQSLLEKGNMDEIKQYTESVMRLYPDIFIEVSPGMWELKEWQENK